MDFYAYNLERRKPPKSLIEQDDTINHVWYHGECRDGFGAAYAAWKLFGDEATYEGVNHGEPPPSYEEGDCVYILDFSYDRETLLQIIKKAKSLIVLDHHESARKQLEDLDFVTFDMNKSGAVLAWEHFHPDIDIPGLLLYIQDRDLWRWEMPDSREVNYALQSYPMDFSLWDNFAFDVSALSELKREGVSIVRMIDSLIEEAAKSAIEIKIADQRVVAVNCSLLRSEVSDFLIQQGSPIVAVYSDGPKGRLWSLRSQDDEHDVSLIASKFGGGGHKQASGFREKKPGQHVKMESIVHPNSRVGDHKFSVFDFPVHLS